MNALYYYTFMWCAELENVVSRLDVDDGGNEKTFGLWNKFIVTI